jgi:NADPH2:quinone reductase
MRVVTFSSGRVEVAERPDPSPGAGQVLVRVRAAGLNNADVLQSRGGYPAPPDSPPDILGLELAGEVAALGPGALRFSVGDRVMAVVGGGAQAGLAVVHERLLMPVPAGVDWPAAGGFPEVFTTAHDALFTQCGLTVGEDLLVHGGAGGVGTAAVQLGAAAGARVTATVRRPELRARVAGLGAEVLDPEEFEGHGPYDVVIELVGARNLPANLRALRVGGRITVIGHGGDGPGELDLGLLMFKRARIHGSTLRARPLEAKADAARRVEAHVLPLLEGGRVAPPVEAAFPLEEAPAAYERFTAGGKFGKIVLVMPAA